MENTFTIIKPDAVEKKAVGAILDMIVKSGLNVSAVKMLHLTKRDAERFYAIHKERPFFGSLTDYMSSGPVVVAVLSGDDAVVRFRKLMGATDPSKAEEGTIRIAFGSNIEQNAVHGSDSLENASIEIPFFFSKMEIFS